MILLQKQVKIDKMRSAVGSFQICVDFAFCINSTQVGYITLAVL